MSIKIVCLIESIWLKVWVFLTVNGFARFYWNVWERAAFDSLKGGCMEEGYMTSLIKVFYGKIIDWSKKKEVCCGCKHRSTLDIQSLGCQNVKARHTPFLDALCFTQTKSLCCVRALTHVVMGHRVTRKIFDLHRGSLMLLLASTSRFNHIKDKLRVLPIPKDSYFFLSISVMTNGCQVNF